MFKFRFILCLPYGIYFQPNLIFLCLIGYDPLLSDTKKVQVQQTWNFFICVQLDVFCKRKRKTWTRTWSSLQACFMGTQMLRRIDIYQKYKNNFRLMVMLAQSGWSKRLIRVDDVLLHEYMYEFLHISFSGSCTI
jgi:hypothetical protein